MAEHDVTIIADGLGFAEAPRVLGAEQYFTVDNQVWRVADGVARPYATLPGQLLSIQWRDGALYAAAAPQRLIYRVDDPAATLAGDESGAQLVADLSAYGDAPINEFLILPAGTIVVGQIGFDPRFGAPPQPAPLLLVETDGTIRTTEVELVFANGMQLLPDGSQLLVAETLGNRIISVPIADGRSPGRARAFAELPDSPDGIALETDGSLWYASNQHLVRVADGGRELDRVTLPYSFATSVALGEPSDDRLFFTAIDSDPSAAADGITTGVFGWVVIDRP